MSPLRVAWLISVLAVSAQCLAQQRPAGARSNLTPADNSDQSISTIHVTSRLVVLDVVVTDAHGNPVHGLKASDFALLEDGVPQKLAAFTEYDASTLRGSPSASPLPANTFAVQSPPSERDTKTVIVIADSTARNPNSEMPPFPSFDASNIPFVRDDVKAVLKSAAPGVAISIVRLDWQGMHLVQGLTTDRQTILEAIGGKRMLPPLGYPVGFTRVPGSPAEHLVRYVSSIPGRVNLVWLDGGGGTGGLQMLNQFPDLTSVAEKLAESAYVLRLSRVALYPININGWFGCAGLSAVATAAGGHAYCNGIRQALHEIVETGSDYYSLSYVPRNPDWNGKFRKIRINVAGYPQTPPPMTWSSFLGWTEEEPSKILYRRGYFARPAPDAAEDAVRIAQGSRRVTDPSRKQISYSPRGDPNGAGAATANPLLGAMELGSLPRDGIGFKLAVWPSGDAVKLKPGTTDAEETLLIEPFQQSAYRDMRLHYTIDARSLTFSQDASGTYSDELVFAAVVYRDDGTAAGSIATTEHVQIAADSADDARTKRITFDQTIQVPVPGNPVPGNFFLHIGVDEVSSGRMGTIEISAEAIKLQAAQTAADSSVAGRDSARAQ